MLYGGCEFARLGLSAVYTAQGALGAHCLSIVCDAGVPFEDRCSGTLLQHGRTARIRTTLAIVEGASECVTQDDRLESRCQNSRFPLVRVWQHRHNEQTIGRRPASVPRLVAVDSARQTPGLTSPFCSVTLAGLRARFWPCRLLSTMASGQPEWQRPVSGSCSRTRCCRTK